MFVRALCRCPATGELMSVFAELYGGLTTDEANTMWINKRPLLQPAVYTPGNDTATGSTSFPNITVERGWWYSAHEKWKVRVTVTVVPPEAMMVEIIAIIFRSMGWFVMVCDGL